MEKLRKNPTNLWNFKHFYVKLNNATIDLT